MSHFENQPFRILAVDDELTVLGLYEQILSPHPTTGESSSRQTRVPGKSFPMNPFFEVLCCNQGNQAVDAVKLSLKEGRPFAVAFVDLNIPPGPDGYWTAEQIHKLDPCINIILVTGYSDTILGELPTKSAFTHKLFYLQKPFHYQEIIQFANALSSKWQAENELDALFCLGDVVGYGPDPKRCLDVVRSSALHAIRGRHDLAIGTGETGSESDLLVETWTHAGSVLTASDRQYLATRPACTRNLCDNRAHSNIRPKRLSLS